MPDNSPTITNNAVTFVPYSDDPIQQTARLIAEAYAAKLPFVDNLTVIIEEPSQSNQLRKQLNAHARASGFETLLGPRICTLKDWVMSQASEQPGRILHQGRELVLLEALKEYPALLNDSDPWRLCATLLEFFDSLSLQQVTLDNDLPAFSERVRKAYQLPDELLPHCQNETRIVHTLWQAWKKHLKTIDSIDLTQYYCDQLNTLAGADCADTDLWILGASAYTQSENLLIAKLLQQKKTRLILHLCVPPSQAWPDNKAEQLARQLGIDLPTDNARQESTAFFNRVFAYSAGQIMDRARQFKDVYPNSPVQNQVSVFAAKSSEQEAQAIDVQIRLWLKQGIQSIGIVVDNRKLARRIRALLERSGITVHDLAGWTLSSTSAATVIERWLECLESNFAYQPFLDLLKSPFISIMEERGVFETLVYRLEHDIILHDNVSLDLDQYLKSIKKRSKQLGWNSKRTIALQAILEKFKQLQHSLKHLISQNEQPAYTFVEAISQSLEALGVNDSFQKDAAGQQLLEALERLQASARQFNIKLGWHDFRVWLGQTLESTHFKPNADTSPVKLLSLTQSKLSRFERMIIASNELSNFPGQASFSPYFNNQVRSELGLTSWREHAANQFSNYRRLLEAVTYQNRNQSGPETGTLSSDSAQPETLAFDFGQQSHDKQPGTVGKNDYLLLLTRTAENEGEDVPISPWLDALQTFHELAYGDDLNNDFLGHASKHFRLDNRTDPAIEQLSAISGSAITLPRDKFPARMSVSNHQQLINCPYQFFCASSLKLRASDEVRETLSKQDYGHRVHLCLQAFHTDLKDLPGPFPEPLTADTRDAAIALLNKIAYQVFAEDIENNYQHRAWLALWQKRIPEYVAWQIKHAQKYRIENTEQTEIKEIMPGVAIKGIIDRVERDPAERFYLIDYKTGTPPSKQDVINGESIQLLSYALLFDNVSGIEYLQLGTQGVKSTVAVDGPTLTELRTRTRDRLVDMIELIGQGIPLNAWGDNKTCQYCEMSGICRQQSWFDSAVSD